MNSLLVAISIVLGLLLSASLFFTAKFYLSCQRQKEHQIKSATTIESLEASVNRMKEVMTNVDFGLLVIDGSQHVVLANRVACLLFQIDDPLTLPYQAVILSPDIRDAVETVLNGKFNRTVEVEMIGRMVRLNLIYLGSDLVHLVLVINDITESYRAEAMKKDFFSNASHELKSPLTSIIGASELISLGLVKDGGEIIELAEKINEEAERMRVMVLKMLSLSQLERRQESTKGAVDVVAIVNEVLSSLSPQIKAKNIETTCECQDAVVFANEHDIYELVYNIIDNSIKYGRTDGHLIVSVTATPEQITMAFKDDGIGIERKYHQRVFQRFYKIDKGRSRQDNSTGLGLSIVKHICLNYSARLILDSEAGCGTTITIIFPVNRPN